MAILLIYTAPLLLANIIHHWVVIPHNLFPALSVPIDANGRFRGRRIFGSRKTIRGFLVVVVLTALCTAVASYALNIPTRADPALLGTLLGVAYMLGELPNSFLKRQADIPESGAGSGPLGLFFSLLDHTDSILFAGVMLYLIEQPPVLEVAALFVFGALVHLAVDILLHSRGYKQLSRGGKGL